MGKLVLLGDEVSLLKAAALVGTVSAHGRTLGEDVACDFFCEAGLVHRAGEELRLTELGWCVARKLIEELGGAVVDFRMPVPLQQLARDLRAAPEILVDYMNMSSAAVRCES